MPPHTYRANPWTYSKQCPANKLDHNLIRKVVDALPVLQHAKCSAVSKVWKTASYLEPPRCYPPPPPSVARAAANAKHARKIFAATKAKRGLSEFQVQQMQRVAARFFVAKP